MWICINRIQKSLSDVKTNKSSTIRQVEARIIPASMFTLLQTGPVSVGLDEKAWVCVRGVDDPLHYMPSDRRFNLPYINKKIILTSKQKIFCFLLFTQ